MEAEGGGGTLVDVLIAGAGPTGLALAAQVAAAGGSVRILERRSERRRDSPALIVQPRTLEVLEPLGVAAALVGRGNTTGSVHLHSGGRTVKVALPTSGMRGTAYPHLLMIPQWEVEAVLEEHLAARGVPVERGTELVSYSRQDGGIECVASRSDNSFDRIPARYLVGCDGADSVVRRLAGIAFPVSSYRAGAVLADLSSGEDLRHDAAHGFIERSGILFLFPLPAPATWRLLVARRLHPRARGELGPGDLGEVVRGFPVGELGLGDVAWLKEIPLRRGQAASYRSGNVFLAGDAAHVHSPAGGQGMNTGIQDAVNLGWKLAMVSRGLSQEELLDSYQAERHGVARWTRRLTDPAFAVETSDRSLVGNLRRWAAPMAAPMAASALLGRAGLRVVGGLLIRYRRSPAVSGGEPLPRGYLRPGDRLPNEFVERGTGGARIHGLIDPGCFSLLLCGSADRWEGSRLDVLRHRYRETVAVHRLSGRFVRRTWRAGSDGPGAPAHYLVRPDGHVAFAGAGSDLSALEAYLDAWLTA